jgi:hypothetical protein
MLILLSPIVVGFWFCAWPEIRIKQSLRVYPNAQQVSEAYGYFGAGSGLKEFYYWTPDSVEDVKRYYQQFTSAFVLDKWSGGWISFVSVDGSELSYTNFSSDTASQVDLQNPRCDYKLEYRCLNVALFSVEQGLDSLPDLIGVPGASSAMNATPYLNAPLTRGTLILYSYYMYDF